MKNMYGIGPGTKYGWSKNILHWTGVHRSILDICAPAPIHSVIAAAVIASVAADFVSASLIGLNPSLV
jgi:hypothetical protein